MRRTEGHEDEQTTELQFELRQTNRLSVKTASDGCSGYLSSVFVDQESEPNEPLMLKQRLRLATERFGFVFHSVIQQKKGVF